MYTVIFDSVFLKSAMFCGILSTLNNFMYQNKTLESKCNSFQIKDCFEARGKKYWEKNLTI